MLLDLDEIEEGLDPVEDTFAMDREMLVDCGGVVTVDGVRIGAPRVGEG